MEEREIITEETPNMFETFVTKFFTRIPKNCSLIKRNRFLGKSVKLKSGNFWISNPLLTEVKLVSHAIRNFDYPAQTFEDIDGQDVVADIAITVKIVDPIKYEYENEDVEVQLKQLLSSIMRTVIARNSYSFLKANRFSLPKSNEYFKKDGLYYSVKEIDEDGHVRGALSPVNLLETDTPEQRREKLFQISLIEARLELDNFARQYGLSVENLYSQEIQQTAEMQEAYNKVKVAEKEAEAKIIEKDAELELAKKDAEIMSIRSKASSEAEKYKLQLLVSMLKDSKLETAQINEILQAYLYSQNEKANVFVNAGDNSTAKAGAIAGVTSENMGNQKRK